MKRKELLQEAEKCLIGACCVCAYNDGSVDCRDNLIRDLAAELDKATLKIIPVGSGENYEVVNNG
ncbi:MAG: hypothetical protein IKU47_08090 [Oscillospiraceae bacterium]|nr:hypothetical protein [Oscillospiraceae bacterium]